MSRKKWCDSGIPLVAMDCLEASLKLYGGIWFRVSAHPRFYNKAWVYSQQYRYLLGCLARGYFTYPRPTAWDMKKED